MEKYKRNCKDQSDTRDNVLYLDSLIYGVDSLGFQYTLPDTLPRFICE